MSVSSALMVAAEASLANGMSSGSTTTAVPLTGSVVATARRGSRGSKRKKIAAPRSCLADLSPTSGLSTNGDLIFNGTGVRMCCQSQAFAWQREGTLHGNVPTPVYAGENIGG